MKFSWVIWDLPTINSFSAYIKKIIKWFHILKTKDLIKEEEKTEEKKGGDEKVKDKKPAGKKPAGKKDAGKPKEDKAGQTK